MRARILLFTLLWGMLALTLLVSTPIRAAERSGEPPTVQELLDILRANGVITEQEYHRLRARERQAPEPKPVAKSRGGEKKEKGWWEDVELGYDRGAYLKTRDGRFSLKLNTRLQFLYDAEILDNKGDKNTFRIRRARLIAGGNFLYPWLKYKTQITLEGSKAALRDYFLEATYLGWLKPKIGQFKVPFDREFLTSSAKLQLIERSIASSEFSLQRDVGVQISGQLLRNRLEYRVGIFNGSAANQTNQDQDFFYAARLVVTPFGRYPYSQGALDGPVSPRLAIGLGLAGLPGLEPGERATLGGKLGSRLDVESDVLQLTPDFAWKYRGISVEAAYHFRHIDPRRPGLSTVDSQGFFVQGGYFLLPGHLEIASRIAWVDPNTDVADDTQREGTVGVTYFVWGHRLKAQLNYTFLKTDVPGGEDREDSLVRTMISFYF
ncbi:MAG: porin [Candidatus Methylomirabilales bacterium]